MPRVPRTVPRTIPRSRLLRRVAWPIATLVIALCSASVAYSAFLSRTTNAANSVASGTVAMSDNDGAVAMLNLANHALGDSDTSCIRTTYTGSLPSTVRHYATVTGSLAPYLTLTVTRGSGAPTFDNCTGFSADSQDYTGAGAGVIYSGK